MNDFTHNDWTAYCESELASVKPLLADQGFILSDEQPHLKGERFLMQAVTTTGGRKLILFGTDREAKRVVIKATREDAGKRELRHERDCRMILARMNFAAEVFHTPPEVAFIEADGFVISVQAFIEQNTTFLERPLTEQFAYALAAFKAQEGAHATTSRHLKLIRTAFSIRNADTYLSLFGDFAHAVAAELPDEKDIQKNYTVARTLLSDEKHTIEQYSGFLTHTDFVPHNFRIDPKGTMYLLDHSSLTFGNKYEGWARFSNFMALYNPPLQGALQKYVHDNRTPEESAALYLMRVYRLGEIIYYYTRTLSQSSGNLHALNSTRIRFWNSILSYTLKEEPVPPEVITTYQNTRDRLRSEDEKVRQRGLH